MGAHESGLIGEDPQGEPGNLMPYVAQVAAGQRAALSVYGNDYPTPDGTGVRDYIHVCDLADGHVAALRYLREHAGLLTVNLGTGRPVSVLEMVRGFEQASGRAVPYQVVARRPGDVAQCWADPALAQQLLGWRATRTDGAHVHGCLALAEPEPGRVSLIPVMPSIPRLCTRLWLSCRTRSGMTAFGDAGSGPASL